MKMNRLAKAPWIGFFLLALSSAASIASLDSCSGGETHFLREPASLTQVGDYCNAWKDWSDRCQKPSSPYQGDFYEECRADPRWKLVWSDALAAFEDCFKTLDCNGSDDRCLGAVITQLNVDPSSDTVYTACMDKAHACEGVLDDECAGVLLYYDKPRKTVERCITLSCEEFGACLLDPASF